MLVRCVAGPGGDISHSIPLLPRLEYCAGLLDDIAGVLKDKRDSLRESNRGLADLEEAGRAHLSAISKEQTVLFSYEALLYAKRRIAQISGVGSIPQVLPSAIPMIRTVSARLYDVAPYCSRRLAELSVQLGSIALDSAALTQARFDFGLSNDESASMLDEVKLMADSKLCKQYPNLDFLKPCTG